MKIAFVGKGGSGKSTVSSLFTRHLLDNKQTVLAIDADINQHFAEMIGAPFIPKKAISDNVNSTDIREYLIGTNKNIENQNKFIKTTPPGTNSQLIRIERDNPVIARHTVPFANNGYFMHVGTYEDNGIGTSCYHTNLAILENTVSHTICSDNEWLIADMVAGTDAFAGPLYLLFDVIFMVVEPTPESVGVYKQFKKLAEAAGTFDRVYVIGNKILDKEDKDYVKDVVGSTLVATIGYDPTLRKVRQRGEAIPGLSVTVSQDLTSIQTFAIEHTSDPAQTLSLLHDLHRRHAAEDYIVARHGDLTNQIDESFSYE